MQHHAVGYPQNSRFSMHPGRPEPAPIACTARRTSASALGCAAMLSTAVTAMPTLFLSTGALAGMVQHCIWMARPKHILLSKQD